MIRFLLFLLFLIWEFNIKILAQASIFNKQQSQLNFTNYNTENGLLHNYVLSIHKDKYGFIWVGTYGGLHKFDQNQFQYFTQNNSDDSKIINNVVHNFYEDDRFLWIATENGVSRYEFLNQTITHFQFPKYGSHVRDIVEDSKGNLYLGLYGSGLLYINKLGKVLNHFSTSTNQALTSDHINDLYITHDTLWIGTEAGGLNRLVKNRLDPIKIVGCRNNFTVNSIEKNNKNQLFIGTWSDGLMLYEPRTNQLLKTYNISNSNISDNTVRKVYYDSTQLILATAKGLNVLAKNQNQFTIIRADLNKPNGLPLNFLWTLLYVPQKGLWLGTFGGGLSYLDFNKNKFTNINSQSACSFTGNDIRCLFHDSRNLLWLSSAEGGIEVFNNNDFCSPHTNHNFYKLRNQKIYTIYEDFEHRIWLGGVDEVYVFSPDLKKLDVLKFVDLNIQQGFTIYSILHDTHSNSIWLGGWNTGLIRIKDYKFESTPNFEVISTKQGLPSNIVWKIFLDSKNQLYVSTNAGLVNYSLESGKIIKTNIQGNVNDILEYNNNLWILNTEFGLLKLKPNGSVEKKNIYDASVGQNMNSFILKTNKLWIGTQFGLLQYNITKDKYKLFTQNDGLICNSFYLHAATTAGPNILFGTSKGVISFNDNYFDTDTQMPDALFTDIQVASQSIYKTNILKTKPAKSLYFIDTLNLSYQNNNLNVLVSSLGNFVHTNHEYQYILKGFDNQTQKLAKDQIKISYTNLPPGTYELEVYVVDKINYKKGKTKKLIITIEPPLWKTWWFYTFIGILIILIFFLILKIRTRIILQRNKELQKQIKQNVSELQEAYNLLQDQNNELTQKTDKIVNQQNKLVQQKQELEQSNSLKNLLFSAISHDIKNPVFNFKSLIQIARLTNSKELPTILDHAEKQADGLIDLTKSLLDWSVFQHTQSESLSKVEVCVNQLITEIIKELETSRNSKNCQFDFTFDYDYFLFCNANALKTIIRNLCSNALKYSHPNSSIKITLETQETNLLINVIDTGVGINAEKLKTLFEYYPNKKTRGTNGELGAGLGLVFCRELNLLNGGEIFVTSKVGKGSCFSLKYTLFKTVDLVSETIELVKQNQIQETNLEHIKQQLKGKSVFLVDDDTSFRTVLNSYLCEFVEVFEFESAETALNNLAQNQPDLIIVDLNMSGMSGLDFIKILKYSESTSHISCIMISSENDSQIINAAYQNGVDDYIIKPFDKNILLQKISNFFHQQKIQILKLLQTPGSDISNLTENPLNKEFMQKIITIIETHITSDQLNADFLCQQMAMSRASLYRKLFTLTGQSVNDFIRTIRLQKSIELIKSKKLNVSEVAYEVGFSSLSYFTNSFKKHFGFSPSEVLKNS